MKKIIVFLIVILLNGLVSYSQADYNKLVGNAEQNIVRSNFTKALEIYNNLEKSYPVMTAIDVHNAIVCAIISNDETNIKKFGLKLSELGLPSSYFIQNPAFVKIRKKKYWLELAKKGELAFLAMQEERAPLKKIVDSLDERDQYFNTISVEKSRNKDTSWIKENKLKYENIIKENAAILLNTFEKFGFPGNNDILFYMPNDYTLSYQPSFSATIIHSYQGKRHGIFATDTFFTPILKQALSEKTIKPGTFAFLQDRGNLDIDFWSILWY